MRVSKCPDLVKHNTILIHYFSHFRTYVALRADFFRAQGYSLLSLMVNPALIVPLYAMQYGGHYREVVYSFTTLKSTLVEFEILLSKKKRLEACIHCLIL